MGRLAHLRLAWAALLFALWLLFSGSLAPAELASGFVVAAVVALAAAGVCAEALAGFELRARWLVALVGLPPALLRDVALVLAAVGRAAVGGPPPGGAFRAVADVGPPRVSATREALLTAGISLLPNSYVLGFDPDTHAVVLHELIPSGEEELPL